MTTNLNHKISQANSKEEEKKKILTIPNLKVMNMQCRFFCNFFKHYWTTVPTNRSADPHSQVPTVEPPFLQTPTISTSHSLVLALNNHWSIISLHSHSFPKIRPPPSNFCTQWLREQCSSLLCTFVSSVVSAGCSAPP